MADPRSRASVGRLGRWTDPASGRAWLLAGLLLLGQVVAWVLATPIFAGPDEPAHAFWAVAVASGELSGEEVPDDPDRREVPVPASLVELGYPGCFAFRPQVPASCVERADLDDEPVVVGTQAARYPPAYYALAGGPLLADAGARSVYLSRGLTALLVAVLAAWALWSVRDDWGPELAIGVTVAVTPMVLFTAAIINPSALEVGANLAVWIAGAGLVLGAAGRRPAAPTAVVGVAGAALALSRPLSVLWVVVTGVALAALADPARRRALTTRRTAAWSALVAAAVAAATGWLLWSGFVTSATTGTGNPVPFGAALRDSFLAAGEDLAQLLGGFGWLDTPLPTGVRYLWLLLLGSLLLVALAVAGRRAAAVLVGLVVALVALPTVLQARVLGTEGFVWQGRYSLPLAVGIPIVAALLVRRERPVDRATARRWLGWVLALVWVGQVVAFLGTLRRYVVGTDGPYPGIAGGPWRPPLGGWGVTALFAAAAAGFALWVWSTAGRPAGDAPPSAAAPPR